MATVDEDEEEDMEQLQYKIIVLGDGTVGKTSVCTRFTDDQFGKSYKQTIGCDFYSKHLFLPGNVRVALQVWNYLVLC